MYKILIKKDKKIKASDYIIPACYKRPWSYCTRPFAWLLWPHKGPSPANSFSGTVIVLRANFYRSSVQIRLVFLKNSFFYYKRIGRGKLLTAADIDFHLAPAALPT